LDEKSSSIFNALRHNIAEDLIFGDAFDGCLRVFHHIATTAMEQAMVSSGGTMAEVTALHENGLKPRMAGP
jgi:hypothetical protein